MENKSSVYQYNEPEAKVVSSTKDIPLAPWEEVSFYMLDSTKKGQVPQFPTMLPNGGMYGGKPCYNKAHIPKPVVHTETYFTYKLLNSANPPPEAKKHFVGTHRYGNNYTAMPEVYWFQSESECKGPYELKVIKRV